MRIGLAWVFLALRSGCAGQTLKGTISSEDRQLVMPLELETSYGQGAIRCTNPETGEEFSGTYTGSTHKLRVTVGGGNRQAPEYFGPDYHPARALLHGTLGSVLTCDMTIEENVFRPHGFGSCHDNNGGRYTLQF